MTPGPPSGDIFVQVDLVVALCFFFDPGTQRKGVRKTVCFNDTTRGHQRIVVWKFFCAAGTLPAEALLRRVKNRGPLSHFCVCLCSSIFVLGYQYSACGIIALEV